MLIYVPEGDEQTYITFASKHPHKTKMLLISFMEDNEPKELVDDLAVVGWAEDNGLMPLYKMPSLNGRLEIQLHTEGSASFGFWTEDEARINMAKARKMLRKHGITGVPHRKLTLADMM